MTTYDPWRDVGSRPDVTVICRHRLSDDLDGALLGRRIWLDRRLGQAGRRSTLAHELVHLDRGVPVGDARNRRREERVVESVAARRLVAFEHLVDAVRWSRDCRTGDLAELLWVDEAMIDARLHALTAAEIAVLDRVLRDG